MGIVNVAGEAMQDRREEVRREQQAAARAQAAYESVLRNAALAKIARLKTVFANYKNTLNPACEQNTSADFCQASGTTDLFALHNARWTAINTQDTRQVDLLFGADSITPIAQALHSTYLSLCLKLYSITLTHVKTQWQAALLRFSDEAAALTFMTDAANNYQSALSLQTALKVATRGINIVLPSCLTKFITAKTATEHYLDILALSFQHFQQQAINPLVAKTYRINPALEVSFEATQLRLQSASNANYQQRKQAYFKDYPAQRVAIEQQQLFTITNIPVNSECIRLAWQHYRTALPNNKSLALAVLSTVLKHSHEPMDFAALKEIGAIIHY